MSIGNRQSSSPQTIREGIQEQIVQKCYRVCDESCKRFVSASSQLPMFKFSWQVTSSQYKQAMACRNYLQTTQVEGALEL